MKNQIIYVAECAEGGQVFDAVFKTIETDSDKLHEYGMDIASTWGGQLIRVITSQELDEEANYCDENGVGCTAHEDVYNYDEKLNKIKENK